MGDRLGRCAIAQRHARQCGSSLRLVAQASARALAALIGGACAWG